MRLLFKNLKSGEGTPIFKGSSQRGHLERAVPQCPSTEPGTVPAFTCPVGAGMGLGEGPVFCLLETWQQGLIPSSPGRRLGECGCYCLDCLFTLISTSVP